MEIPDPIEVKMPHMSRVMPEMIQVLRSKGIFSVYPPVPAPDLLRNTCMNPAQPCAVFKTTFELRKGLKKISQKTKSSYEELTRRVRPEYFQVLTMSLN